MKNLVLLLIPWLTMGNLMANSGEVDFFRGSFAEAKQLAKEQDKPIFIDFYAVWCGPCKYMEKYVFVNEGVAEFMNENFISMRVDAEKEELDLVDRINLEAYPTLAYFNAAGKMTYKFEGALDSEDFVLLSNSVLNKQSYKDAYDKSGNKPENVFNYASALKWIDQARAERVATRYLKDVPSKKWVDEENWKIIRDFIPGTNQGIFSRVSKNEELASTFPEEYGEFIRNGVGDILAKSIDLKSDYHLKRYEAYVNQHKEHFSNADSLILLAKIGYAEQAQPGLLPGLLGQYIDKYESNNPETLTRFATFLAQNFHQKDILFQAIEWADQVIGETAQIDAYLAASLAYERMNDFKSAYAYILLAESKADEEWDIQLESHGIRLKDKLALQVDGEGVTVAENSKHHDDGRFTLGAGMKRLMYGYPVPTSTSHFVINVNGKLATNSSKLASQGLHYLNGLLQYGGSGMTPEVQITFEFEGVQVTQQLIPVNKTFQPISTGLAQYYRVSYQFHNQGNDYKKVGLGVLFDTMIDDNDHCAIAADGRILPTELGFAGKNMPEELLFYRTKGDSTDMMGAAVLQGHEATKPDKLVVGRWPVLHHVTWELKPQRVKYGDSAYFLKWENRRLNPEGELSFVTYYGLPQHKEPELRILVDDPHQLTMTETIFFETGSSKLDLNAKMHIGELLEDDEIMITGVLLNGYADVQGGESVNFNLSQKRINNVGKIFKAHGIPFVPKPYGFDKAVRTSYNQTYGNVWDRKVEIVIYYKQKSQDLIGQL